MLDVSTIARVVTIGLIVTASVLKARRDPTARAHPGTLRRPREGEPAPR